MKTIIIILGITLMILLVGCSESYYQSDVCDCEEGYFCVESINPDMNYCVRPTSTWDESGEKDFKLDKLECNNSQIITRHNYSCYQMRLIIDLGLDIYPTETIHITSCNYPRYSENQTTGEGDFKLIYIEECFQ